MMKVLVEFVILSSVLNLNFVSTLPFSPTDVFKELHKGADQTLKGFVGGLTEVTGNPVNIKDLQFYLHTSKDNGYPNHTIDPLNPTEVAQTDGKIYFIVHGWTQNREETPWYRPLTEFLLGKCPNAYVVQIDWSKSAGDNFASAAFSTEGVGNILGNLIYKLVKEFNVPLQNIVVIGHSLGGQVTGWVGKTFFKLTHSKLPRIIALDPAGPLFSVRPDERRLNQNDADVVMVLHSDGGKLGFGDKCGTIDFYPNGGSNQPGCLKVETSITDPLWCDHRRGYDLFVEAVKAPNSFMAKKCKNYDQFKENKCEDVQVSLGDLETHETGSFYLDTSDKPPFIKLQETVGNGTRSMGVKPYQLEDDRTYSGERKKNEAEGKINQERQQQKDSHKSSANKQNENLTKTSSKTKEHTNSKGSQESLPDISPSKI